MDDLIKKKKPRKEFTLEERHKIEEMIKLNYEQYKIAKVLGRHHVQRYLSIDERKPRPLGLG